MFGKVDFINNVAGKTEAVVTKMLSELDNLGVRFIRFGDNIEVPGVDRLSGKAGTLKDMGFTQEQVWDFD